MSNLPSSSRAIPPLLTPYLSLPPPSSLILLTSVLGAGTNWLVLRYLSSLLSGENEPDVKVVFLSFMRDMNFWREGGRKINLDLDKATQQNRFLFIDGLTSLYLPQTQTQPPPSSSSFSSPPSTSGTPLTIPSLPHISQLLSSAITQLSSPSPSSPYPKTILILDSPDLLLATSSSPTITSELNSLFMNLRSLPSVHSLILTLSIDTPLISSSSTSHPQTPLETNSAAFITSLGHEADLVMGTRLLDTGAARDVSGVLRVTGGGGTDSWNLSEDREKMEEKELLYFVNGDGSVKVFERGQ